MSLKQLKLMVEQRVAKLCLSNRVCVKSSNKPVDYDFTPYEIEKLNSPNNAKTKEAVNQTSVAVKAQIEKNRISLENLNRLKKQTTQIILYNESIEFDAPELHSTQLEQLNRDVQTHYQIETFLCTTIDTLDTNNYLDDGLIEEVDENDSYLICCESYNAEYRDDLSVHRNDRVQVVMVKEAFILGRNIDTDECGFVPRNCFI